MCIMTLKRGLTFHIDYVDVFHAYMYERERGKNFILDYKDFFNLSCVSDENVQRFQSSSKSLISLEYHSTWI